jgi:hypothetical protein
MADPPQLMTADTYRRPRHLQRLISYHELPARAPGAEPFKSSGAARQWFKSFIVLPVETQTVEIVSMPPPEHRPLSSSPERKRELGPKRASTRRN